MGFDKKIAVIVVGSWATATVKILVENLDEVNCWMLDQISFEYIKEFHHNPKYIQSIRFDLGE